jgi:hypothetical protein
MKNRKRKRRYDKREEIKKYRETRPIRSPYAQQEKLGEKS